MNKEKNERLHSLDAVRAIALLLGIVLHATMSFIMPIPALDSSQSTTLSVTFYVIHIFRMSAFYLIAGFFARLVLERRGLRQFVRDRARRILIPMVAGWLVLAPPLIAVVIWGISRTFGDELPEGFDQGPAGFPLIHLWFLYYLTIFYVLALALRGVIGDRAGRDRAFGRGLDAFVRRLVESYAGPVLLAAPLAAVLYLDPSWIVWAGIPTPDVGLTPKIPALVGFGAAFALGWLVHRQIDLLGVWRRRWPANLTVAAALTGAALAIVGPTGGDMLSLETLTVVPGSEWMRAVYAACYTLAVWYWTFALVGAATQCFAEASALWRYLADASYWVYLAHLPLIFFLQVLLADVPLHWSVKFPLILGVSMTLLLVTYRYWVRYTWLGALLNGRRHLRPGGDASGRAAAGAASS